MSGPDADNWVRVRAECTTEGFLRKLRAEICQDVIEANKQFDPDRTFSLSDKDAPDVRVFRQLKGTREADAFVLFAPSGPTSISISVHRRNGGYRALYSEQPMGELALEWDHQNHRCAITLAGAGMTTLDLRRRTLGDLIFE